MVWHGRRVRPVALFLSIITAYVGVLAFAGQLVGQSLDGAAGDVLGVLAVAAAGLMWAGWWSRRDDPIVLGVSLSAGVWVSVAAITGPESVSRAASVVAETGDWWRGAAIMLSPVMSLCWAGIAGTSWWIERDRPEGRP